MNKKNSYFGSATAFVRLPESKNSQVYIFIIIAIAVVIGIILYFVFRSGVISLGMPQTFKPVYNYYLGCIDNEVKLGASLVGQHAGYINVDELEFSPGSVYMPFSSQLDFLGNGVPYWYYISGNGVIKEQVPTKENIEIQLNNFVSERLRNCDFSSFVEKGYRIEIGREAVVATSIKTNVIETRVMQDIAFYFGNDSYHAREHYKEVNFPLGKFYETAISIYDSFKKTLFLENYSVDILRLNAPVDGTVISCSPLVWNIGEVAENLTQALEANIGFIKIKGNYYNIGKEEHRYFIHDIGEDVELNVNFLYLRDWPMKLEVWPSENGILTAEPVGLEEGFGVLGFCYVPYHFVYDFGYPVLIQLYYEDSLFQFPVVVYINKNRPREPLEGESSLIPSPELCLYRNTPITIKTYDRELNPVKARISFKCFDSECLLGESTLENSDAVLETNTPQCVNGYVIARAEGYETARYLTSTVEEQDVNILLNKEYEINVEVRKDGKSLTNNEHVIVSFKKENSEKTINYPEQNITLLSDGQYTIRAYIYSRINILLESSFKEECVEVSKSGIPGIFGATEEKCFELEIPSQNIEAGVSGGGTQNYYITENELKNAKKIIIDADNFGVPQKIEDIQLNYNLLDSSRMNIYVE
ncbi:hypothetical protein J4221_02245 [Candidatus Pacearchaeota archaeon]|nr:hypothetical protein [Candidatus Pacearchaeota archaeon]